MLISRLLRERLSGGVGLVVICGLLAAGNLSAQSNLTLTISNPTITGTPSSQFTLNGTIQANGVTASLIPGSGAPFTLTGSSLVVLQLLTPGGLSIADGSSYTGPIALVQIAANAAPGSYPNTLSLSYDDDNGRTGSTTAANLTVTVQAVVVPTPTLGEWAMIGLSVLLAAIGFWTIRRRATPV